MMAVTHVAYQHDAGYYAVLVVLGAVFLVCASYAVREWREPGPSRTPPFVARGRTNDGVRGDSANATAADQPRQSVPPLLSVRPPADLRRRGTSESPQFSRMKEHQ